MANSLQVGYVITGTVVPTTRLFAHTVQKSPQVRTKHAFLTSGKRRLVLPRTVMSAGDVGPVGPAQPSEASKDEEFADMQGPSQAPSQAGVSTEGLSEEEAKFVTACYDADVSTLEAMIGDGQDPNITDVNRRTALHFCAGNGLPTICQKLMDVGANINAQDVLGFTPLHMAAGYKMLNTVRWLVDVGADANIASFKGELPVEIAESIFEKTPEKRFFMANEEHSKIRQIVDILDEATEVEEEFEEEEEEAGDVVKEITEETGNMKYVVRVMKPKGVAPPVAPPPPVADVKVTIRVKEPDSEK